MSYNTAYLPQATKDGISIEFFSVSPDKHESCIEKIIAYETLGINCINITCKSSHTEDTRALVKLVRERTSMHIIPHIVAYKLTKKELDETLQLYDDLGITTVLVIRGDLDTDSSRLGYTPDFLYAVDLVRQIRAWNKKLCIGVAGYPERHYQEPNCLVEMQHLVQKIQAGADYIVTQLFFDNSHFYNFLELCALYDIDVPVIPGLTYIKNKAHTEVIARIAAGSKIPSALLREIFQGNDTFGEEWLYKQVADLKQSPLVDIIHLYVFNSLKVFQDVILQYKNTQSPSP